MTSNFIEQICLNNCYLKIKIPNAKSEGQKEQSECIRFEVPYNSKNKSQIWNRQANIESVVQRCVSLSDTQALKWAKY